MQKEEMIEIIQHMSGIMDNVGKVLTGLSDVIKNRIAKESTSEEKQFLPPFDQPGICSHSGSKIDSPTKL